MSIDVRRETGAQVSEDRLSTTWEVDLDYVSIARYASLVVERRLPHSSARNWATERMTLDGLFPSALMTFRDRTEKTALLDLTTLVNDTCIAHVALEHETLYLRVAAQHVESLAEAEAWIRELYPETTPEREQRVAVTFWAHSERNRRSTRTLEVPAWRDVEDNYPRRVRAQLAAMLEDGFRPSASGQLVLWHGRPGTGKTSALRALAWEWRNWCRLHYVTDPETFFGTNPRYMLDLILDEEEDGLWQPPRARRHRRAPRCRCQAPHRPRSVTALERRRRADRPGSSHPRARDDERTGRDAESRSRPSGPLRGSRRIHRVRRRRSSRMARVATT